MKDIQKIITEVCEKYGITEKELKGPSRIALFVSARKELSQRLRKEAKLSYSSIGFIINRKDHSTIINYLK